MNQGLNNKIAVFFIAVILFSGVAYLGYRFIQDVGISVAQITDEPAINAPLNITDENLSQASDTAHHWTENASSVEISVNSNGEDVLIQAGDFAYAKSRPIIHLKIHNQAAFATNQVFIRLSLWLDQAKKAVGEAVIVPVALKAPLLSGQSQTIELTVDDEKWLNEAVRQAKVRRVMAQVVGVSDANTSGMDYPQTSKAVVLSQSANHWENPEEILKNSAIALDEHQLTNTQNTQINVMADKENQYKDPDDISAYLEKPLPTGEPRIFSVEVKEYRDGEEVKQ